MKTKIFTIILGLLLIVSIVGNIVLFNNNKKLSDSAIQFNAKIEELETAVVNKETELKDSENKVSELEKQITDLQSQLDTLNENVSSLEAEKEKLLEQLTTPTPTTEEKSTEKITLEPDENGEITVTQEEADAIAEQLLEEIMKGAENTTPQYDYSNLPEGCTPDNGVLPGNNFGSSGFEDTPAGRLE